VPYIHILEREEGKGEGGGFRTELKYVITVEQFNSRLIRTIN